MILPKASWPRLGLSFPFDDFVDDWEDIFWLNEPVSRLIASLKSEGYTLILGSNTNSCTPRTSGASSPRRSISSTHSFSRMKSAVSSRTSSSTKRAFAPLELPAASCVFIDDLAENVEGARKAGLKGVHYVDDPNLIANLRKLGVEIPPVNETPPENGHN